MTAASNGVLQGLNFSERFLIDASCFHSSTNSYIPAQTPSGSPDSRWSDFAGWWNRRIWKRLRIGSVHSDDTRAGHYQLF